MREASFPATTAPGRADLATSPASRAADTRPARGPVGGLACYPTCWWQCWQQGWLSA
jgi:hypothetical protein